MTKPSKYKRWTTKEITQFVTDIKNGKSPQELAPLLGRTEKSVLAKFYELRLHVKTPKEMLNNDDVPTISKTFYVGKVPPSTKPPSTIQKLLGKLVGVQWNSIEKRI